MEIEKTEKFLRGSNKFVYTAIILATALIFLLLGMYLAFLYIYRKEVQSNNGSNNQNSNGATVDVRQDLAALDRSFYYISESRLFKITQQGSNYVKKIAANLDSNSSLAQYLGGNDWGYLGNTRNDPAKGYVTDLGIFNEETGVYTLLKEFSSDTLGPVAWADKDSFVYTIKNADSNLMDLYYYDNGTETLLSSSLPGLLGRGYGTDLVLRLIFSPAKDKVLFISTIDLDQRNLLFVFDLQANKQLIKLENIYTADWLDNSNIVYQDQEKEVLKFNLKTNTKTSVAKHSDYLVGMRALQNKVVFWKYQVEPVDSNLYSYDLNSGETRLLLESATAPVWLSDTKVVAVRLQDNNSEFILNPKTSSGLVVIDLKLSQVTLLEETLSDKSIYNLSTIYNPSANESFLGLD